MAKLEQPYPATLPIVRDYLDEHNAGWNIGVVDNMPPLTDFNERVFLGSWSWTFPAGKKRLLLAHAAQRVGANYVSPSAATRAYLAVKYPDIKLRMTGAQAEKITVNRAHPLYAYPCVLDDAVYLDLKSAFWSIVKVVGWDVDYNPSKWLGVRSSVADYPFADWKFARNCLVSLARPGNINVWDGGAITSTVKRNPHINFGLVALVYDVLHGIAEDMRKVGAVYVHTDGYIMPVACEPDAMAVLASWGLVGGAKDRGAMEVVTAGTYRTPSHKPSGAMALARHRPFDSVYPVDREWLRKRFYHFASKL